MSVAFFDQQQIVYLREKAIQNHRRCGQRKEKHTFEHIWVYGKLHTHIHTPNSEKWNSENSCQGDDADGCGGKGGGGTAKNPFHSVLNEIVNTLAQRDSSTGSMWYFWVIYEQMTFGK